MTPSDISSRDSASEVPAIVAVFTATDFSLAVVQITIASDLSPFNSRSFSRNHRRTVSVQFGRRLATVQYYLAPQWLFTDSKTDDLEWPFYVCELIILHILHCFIVSRSLPSLYYINVVQRTQAYGLHVPVKLNK